MGMTEAERALFIEALLNDLAGTPVEVDGIGTPVLPLTRKGAQAVIDRLKARDFKVVRAD